jgi:hypothetical protein
MISRKRRTKVLALRTPDLRKSLDNRATCIPTGTTPIPMQRAMFAGALTYLSVYKERK